MMFRCVKLYCPEHGPFSPYHAGHVEVEGIYWVHCPECLNEAIRKLKEEAL